MVIPAHNEGRVIGRCLRALREEVQGAGGALALDITVAANGCRDDTVAQAGQFPEARVLDLPRPSKADALNAADEVAQGFPRIYLDADVVLSPGTLTRLAQALSTEAPRLAAPAAAFLAEASSWPVRAFYQVYAELPYVRSSLGGVGVYGLSAAGRARFDRFPALQGDDLFAQRLFAPGERLLVAGSSQVRVPHDLRNLVRIRARVAQGNLQLAASAAPPSADFSTSTRATVTALALVVRRRPSRAAAVAVYVGVILASRAWSRLSSRAAAKRGAATTWQRDTSTR